MLLKVNSLPLLRLNYCFFNRLRRRPSGAFFIALSKNHPTPPKIPCHIWTIFRIRCPGLVSNIHGGAHTTTSIGKFLPSGWGSPCIPHIRGNEAVSNSGRPKSAVNFRQSSSPPTRLDPGRVLIICHFLFHPTDARGRQKKRAAPRDGRPLARLGAWLLLFTAEVLLTENRKIAQKSPLPLQAARRV